MINRVFVALFLLLQSLAIAAHATSPSDKQTSATELESLIADLTDQHGVPLTRSRLYGKPAIVHFGFTHCPVVCPTTLNEVALLMERLGSKADRINFLFVTVDPERDTADILKTYVSHFDARIIGVTGSEKAIAAIARSFGTSYAKRQHEDGYNMDHAIYAYLKDSRWRTVGTLYLGSGANQKLVNSRIEALLKASVK